MSKLQVNDIVDKDDVSAPGFSKGAVITGVCTATTFVGALTGNADTATTATSTSGNAGGLTGSPDIAVGQVTAGVSTFSGDVTFTGDAANVTWDKSTDDLKFADGAKAIFGTGGDLKLSHDGTNSYIESDTGDLIIGAGNGTSVKLMPEGGEDGLTVTHNGAVEAYYDNSKRFETTSSGVTLSGSGGTKRLGVGPTLSEKTKVTAGKLSDNTNIDLADGNVHLFTTAESTTCTPNIRVDSSTTLNSVMDVGETTVITLITTANASAYSEHITIDGSAVAENWIGGSAPAAGGSSGVDIHSFTIIKTAANTYTVLGNHSKTS